MQVYFKAIPKAQKFHNTPLDFLPLLKELFEGVFASGKHAILVQETINSHIDLELLCLSKAAISQVTNSTNKENEREDEEVVKENVEPDLFESQ